MKEIGSEFWDIPLSKMKQQSPLLDNTVWYLSGRSALNAILDDICSKQNVKTAALPSWCCDSMILPFLKHDISISFYSVYLDNNNSLVQDLSEINNANIVLVMDYFGYQNLPEINLNDCIVIRDLTHSIFVNSYDDADYYFGSLRKWAGFYTGGFAYQKDDSLKRSTIYNEEYTNLRRLAMSKKEKYISGRISDKSFLELFSKAEEILDLSESVYSADERDISCFNDLDIEYIKRQRRKNAAYLINELNEISIFKEINDDACPLFVPIIIDQNKRDNLRRYLISRHIYCPIHWCLTEYHNLKENQRDIYYREISVVCDQRYDIEEMKGICNTIKEFLRW